MTSKTSTPTASRRNLFLHDNDDSGGGVAATQSRIPLPSPGPFRRSVSLRLRGSQNGLNNTNTTPISGVKTTTTSSTNALNCSSQFSRSEGLDANKKDIWKSGSQLASYGLSTSAGLSPRRDLSSSRSLTVITADSSSVSLPKDPLNGDSAGNSDNSSKSGSKSGSDAVDSGAGSRISIVKRESHGMSLSLNGTVTTATAFPSTTLSTTQASPNSTIRTPKIPNYSSNPVANKLTPKTPPVTPDSPHIYLDDDLDSLFSYSSVTSGRSTMSCEHPYVARNGTTFSGRKMKYVVHCSSYAGQVGEDYLTPTQRAQRQLRRLKELLTQARHDLERKDNEILRLTREVVELRLFKASLSSPEDRSNSSDAVTVREATTELKTSQDVSPIVDMIDEGMKASPRHVLHQHGIHQVQFMDKISNSEMQSSFADSGHFEDLTTSSVHSKDSFVQTHDRACGSDTQSTTSDDQQRQELIQLYEKRIEDLIRMHDASTSELKRSHNDKVEALLQKLAECNTRYADIVPDYEQAKERIRELEKQLEDLQRRLQEHEEKQKKMYLHMYTKGQEAERMAHAEQVLEFAHRAPSRVSVPELLQQLQNTQDELENIRTIYRRLMEAQQNKTRVDPEVTLQFLKSAIYYFLTDKENSQGHLNAIESILEFSEQEKYNISKARQAK